MAINHVDITGHGDEDLTETRGFFHGHDPVPIHNRFQRAQRIYFGDDDVGPHAAGPLRQPAPTPTVARDHEVLPRQQYIRRTHNPVHCGLPCSVAIVEEVLCHRIVDRNNRKGQLPVLSHRAQANHAGGGFLRSADHVSKQLPTVLVQRTDKIRPVIHRNLGAMIERSPDMPIVGDVVLTFDRKHRDLRMGHQGGCDVILRGQWV